MGLFKKKNELQYIAVFCIPEGKGYRIRSKKRFNPNDTDGIKAPKLEQRITGYDINGYFTTEGLRRHYYFDLSAEGKQIYTNDAPLPIDPSIAYLIIDRHVVRDLTYDLSDNKLKMQILPFILGAVIGIFGTISVMSFME
jgi:hypothetical protein